MVKCLIYHCGRVYGDPCCTYCDLQADCPDRCQNRPDRCKCWEDLPDGQRRAKPHTLYDSRQIVALYHEGRSYDQIAEEVGCGRSTVTLILRKAGELSRKGRGPIIDYDMVRTLHDVGLTNREVARRLGCSEASVSIILRQRRRDDG